MRATFLTEGTSQTGYGHLSRTKSLYQAAESLGFDCFILANYDVNASVYLDGLNVENFDWKKRSFESVTYLNDSELVFFDSYQAGIKNIKEIVSNAEDSVKFAYIDDFNRLDYPNGTIINYSVGSNSEMYEGQSGKKSYLLGPRYALLAKEYWQLSNQRPEISKSIETILLTFGGADNANLTKIALETLSKNFPSISFEVIIGPGNTSFDSFSSNNKKVRLNRSLSISDMKTLIERADLCLTACGHTTYEIAATGRPMIAVLSADNQKLNAQGWKAKGIPVLNGLDSNFRNNLIEIFLRTSPSEVRKSLSEIASTVVDPRGAINVIKTFIASN
ncbi:glycosyltransferase family 28 C-terminal domain protein [Leptospira fainei serovar Hurstbridge str. BUT 6]|uniref:Glycosyltransferase family 28 C-terminal domain protein n=1 Tax=Leptospira fainei serovar Hurstbridge str. BUT 6 TaxID=1193011 RepID=S3W7S0_9LEPT|nr:glycosyltransferase [Leptospira fainei]EPG76137.1 glycosyltransferase family 28 C-terminal domain protein [Leptospira fainei serovar Hurstbridge str. BUT 6]